MATKVAGQNWDKFTGGLSNLLGISSKATEPANLRLANYETESAQDARHDSLNQDARGDVLKAILLGGLGGVGIGGSAYLLKKLLADEEDEIAQPDLVVVRKKAADGQELVPPASPFKPEDVWWRSPGMIGGGVGSALLGYALIRKLTGNMEESDLEDQKLRAEQEFQDVLTQSLAGTGLEVRASEDFSKLSDVEACTTFLVKSAEALFNVGDQPAEFIKEAMGTGDKILLGLLGGLGVSTGLGGWLGWKWSAANNPHRAELDKMKKRRALKQLYTPKSPTIRVISTAEDDEEDEKLLEEEAASAAGI